MVSREVTIINPSGLHLKPAAVFSTEALKYDAVITVTASGFTANAKSVLSVLAACVREGDTVEIACTGPDEAEALENVCRILEEGLGEIGENA